MISDVLELLKPWLNMDLWKHLEENKKNIRLNANWGQKIEE